MGATVAVDAVIDCACMNTILICCIYAAESVLCVCELVACICAGEWIQDTLNANFLLAHFIMLVVCSIGGNFVAVSACFLVLLA